MSCMSPCCCSLLPFSTFPRSKSLGGASKGERKSAEANSRGDMNAVIIRPARGDVGDQTHVLFDRFLATSISSRQTHSRTGTLDDLPTCKYHFERSSTRRSDNALSMLKYRRNSRQDDSCYSRSSSWYDQRLERERAFRLVWVGHNSTVLWLEG
jgi:hypothetical protein